MGSGQDFMTDSEKRKEVLRLRRRERIKKKIITILVEKMGIDEIAEEILENEMLSY